MESITLGTVLKILGDFGTIGLVIFLWWSDNRRIMTVLNQYKIDMGEQRKMYEANVSLCRDFASIANDLRDIVTLNIQTMTEVKDAVNQNQFCPLVRVDQQKISRLTKKLYKDISGDEK
jgi:ribosome-associated protein YbcJ (S4-like RNA binding protein)